MKKSFIILSVFTMIFCMPRIEAQEHTSTNDAKMQWWKDAKFGMFIHWGVYSVPAGKWGDTRTYGEWIMNSAKIPRAEYSALTKQFNPVKYNAEEWVKLAKAAGQKYMVITSKHHDGFAMFHSKATPYNIYDATPFKRDVLKELAEACRKYDMKLGFYYSQAQDWYHPGGAASGGDWDDTHKGDMLKYIKEIALPQVKELLTEYGDVAVFWWDTPTNMTEEMARIVSEPLKDYPNIITNNRLGSGFGGDLETPEQYIPATGFPGRNWEVCMTMNGHWGYCAYDEDWKSTDELIKKLVDIVSKGGNYLLNVGPTQDGIIPEVCQKTLREIGAWLDVNGEAIYGTTASPFPYLSWGRATRKGQTLYLHIFDWPKDGILHVPLLNDVTMARLLADPKTSIHNVKKVNGGIEIKLPNYAPDKTASVVAINFNGEPNVLPVPSQNIKVKPSSSKDEAEIVNITDGDPKTSWSAKKGEHHASIEIDLGTPTDIQCLSIASPWSAWSGVTQETELQAYVNGEWKTVFKKAFPGVGGTEQIPVTNAQKFRLILDNEKHEPALQEFILYRAE